MSSIAWDVHRLCVEETSGNQMCDHLIDTVWFDVRMDADEVKRSLVEHDGYPDDISVTHEHRAELRASADTRHDKEGS